MNDKEKAKIISTGHVTFTFNHNPYMHTIQPKLIVKNTIATLDQYEL